MMKRLSLIMLLTILTISQQNCGGGFEPDSFSSSQDLPLASEEGIFEAASTSAALPYQIVQVKDQPSRNLDFRFKVDMNKDGVRDLLNCNGKSVSVWDGKNTSRRLFLWNLPNPTISHPTYSGPTDLTVVGCSIARINGNNPSIVIGSSYTNPAVGLRIPAIQYILYDYGGTPKGGTLKLIPQAFKITQEGKTFTYKAQTRSVKCQKYPQALVNKGYRAGAICFYAAYDGFLNRGDSPGGGTNTALFKFEVGAANRIRAIDLTISSGLPWTGGALGTPLAAFPKFDGYDNKRDGIHMMDSTFLDYNSDGLADLITLGQHTSIRLSTMRYDSSRREGMRFDTSIIHRASRDTMSEFLRVQAFNELNGNIGYKCIYISGEIENVPDHVRCYHGGTWKTIPLPIMTTRGVREAGIAKVAAGSSNIKMRAYDQLSNQYKSFVFRKTPGPVIGYIDRVDKVASGLRVRGWACQFNVYGSTNVHVYVGGPAGQGGTHIYSIAANKPSGAGVIRACNQNANFRYDTVIPASRLRAHRGKKIYIHGIKLLVAGPGGNALLTRSGQFAVPAL